jgi:hypothetical protein
LRGQEGLISHALSTDDSLERNITMLAQFLIIMLVGCVLILLAGWVGDEMRAGWWEHDSVRPTASKRMRRREEPWYFDDSDATWTTLPFKR